MRRVSRGTQRRDASARGAEGRGAMTNVVDFDSRASMGRQAREWLIRLDGDVPLSGEEQAGLREWLNRSPLHREELTRLARFWNSANVLTELAVPLERAADARRARHRTRIFTAVAASVLFASVIAGLWWWTQKAPLRANGIYGRSEERRVGKE